MNSLTFETYDQSQIAVGHQSGYSENSKNEFLEPKNLCICRMCLLHIIYYACVCNILRM